jgi:hypothetical protein
MESEVDVLRNTYRFPVTCSQGSPRRVRDLTYITLVISASDASASAPGRMDWQLQGSLQKQVTSTHTKQICFSHALQQLTRGQVSENSSQGKRNQQDIQRLTSTGYTR